MNRDTFLGVLREKNVVLKVDDEGALDIEAPAGVLSGDLITEIRTRKGELLEYLRMATHLSTSGKEIPQAAPAASYPLSSSQIRLWFIDNLRQGSTAYNMTSFFEIFGPFDPLQYELAIRAVIERHEVLRTAFREDDNGEVRQWILQPDELNFTFPFFDMRTEKAGREKALRLIREDTTRPFNLRQPPLFRMMLFRLEDERCIFYCNMHHIISDEWSMKVLYKDVKANYDAYRNQIIPTLPSLKLQYKDYAAWQQQQLAQPDRLDRHRRYWLAQLSGTLPVLELPMYAPRPGVQTFQGGSLEMMIDHTISQSLKTLCQDTGATLFMGVVAALQAIFYRYTGLEDIILGTAVAGRDHVELEDQIGFYVNTLVLRTQLKGSEGFLSLLDRVRELTLSAYEHQSYPFDRLVEELSVSRDTSRSALFDVAVGLQNRQEGREEKVSQTPASDIRDLGPVQVKLDLHFNFAETDQGLTLRVEYNRDIYTYATIARFVKHFRNLLRSLTIQPDRAISQLIYLTQQEEAQLLEDFNATSIDYPRDKTIVDMFREQVARQPDRIALAGPKGSLSYAALESRSNQLASYLARRGVKHGCLVGICFERSMELVLGALAILKAGGAYVPIDPSYPPARVGYMLMDSGTQWVISDSYYRELLEEGIEIGATQKAQRLEMQRIYLDLSATAIDQEPPTPMSVELSPHGLAYVIYTSGSTGQPKGVMIEHTSVVNLICWYTKAYHFQPESRSTIMAGVGFDAGALETWSALLSGSTLYIVDDMLRIDRDGLMAFYQQHSITHSILPPGLLPELVKGDQPEGLSLQYILIGGDRLGAMPVDRLSYKLVNQYGPTESTVMVSEYHMQDDGKPPPIGRPIANVQLYILDGTRSLLPVGVSGELYISGIGLARGYWGRKELTAERFIYHRFGDGPEQRLYRTGDLCRWLADGNIEYLGRIDDQVKIRGFRIELGEIEHALQQLDGIESAVVSVYEASKGDRSLIGYVVSEKEQSGAHLRQQLERILPAYMVPAHYIQLDRLPLTINGKIDRKALPRPDTSTRNGEDYIAPRTDIEQQVAGIWEQLLSRPMIGAVDDFFISGGDSLKLMQLVNHYHRAFEIKLSIQDLFTHSTVAGQAALITASVRTQYDSIAQVPVSKDYAVSDGQRRLWVLSQLEEGSRAYHLSGHLLLHGRYSAAAFSTAIRQVINRHEILRTVFREDEQGRLRQLVLPEQAALFQLQYKDLEGWDKQAIQHYLQELSWQNFDLSQGPLLRAALLRTGEEQYIFHYTMHHIISDGWSMEVLRREVMHYYQASEEGRTAELPKLRLQYKDYAAWQQQQLLQPDSLDRHRRYWLERLSGELPVLELPMYAPRPGRQTFQGGALGMMIDHSVLQSLKALCQTSGATLFMGIIAALQAMFYRYTGQEDIILGTPVAGRDHVELEDQIGFYINTLVLRTPLKDSDPFLALLDRVRETTLSAYEHQSYPFDRLVEELSLKRDTSRSALFDVAVVLQNQQEIREGNVAKGPATDIQDLGPVLVKLDLHFNFWETDRGLVLRVEYNSDIYTQTTIARFMGHYRNLLRSLTTAPETEIGRLMYLTKQEEEQLLEAFNATSVDYPRDKTIIDIFREQVARQPELTAIAGPEGVLSYVELENRSNQLASYLARRGVKRGSLVAICFDRSVELIVGVVAILKAGGAYVPIDPSYPPGRIGYMLMDSGTQWVISDSYYRELLEEGIEAASTQKAQGLEIQRIYLDRSATAIDQEPSSLFNLQLSPHDLAYVIYTSGSTGRPKGVMIEHTSMVNLINWHIKAYDVRPESRSTMMAGVGFDAGALETWSALLSRSTLYIVGDALRIDRDELMTFYHKHGITHCFVPPGLIPDLVKGDQPEELLLRYILIGGDRLGAMPVERLSYTLVNQYGPTESTVMVTEYPLQEDGKQPPIGRPIANVQLYILDGSRSLLPIGVSGELYIGGTGLARGYWGKEELTAERFIQHRFGTGPEQRLYRTGDLCRWLADGNIEYLGRIDDQVKIRGFRIELGEVEHALQQLNGIESAVVNVYEAPEGDRSLVGYIVSEREQSGADLRQQLERILPAYMVPSYYVQLDQLPLTVNGKIDRKVLPSPETSAIEGKDYLAPEGDRQSALAWGYQEVLHREQVGALDNFFELGGDSIKAILLVSRLKQKGYQIRVADVLKYPVLEELAERLTITEPELLSIQGPVEGPVVLTPVQRWFLSAGSEEASPARSYHHYNQSVLLYSAAGIVRESLEKSLEMLVHHHDALRMVYRQGENGWEQYNRGTEEGLLFHLEEHDLRDAPLQDAKRQLGRLCSHLQAGINLEQGPLLRVGLFRLEDGDRLLLAIHHLVIDGVSWRLLLEDLSTCYTQAGKGEEILLPLRSDSFQRWAAYQQEYVERGMLRNELPYWQHVVRQGQGQLPIELGVTQRWFKDTASVNFSLGPALTKLLQTSINHVYNTDINDILLAALTAATGEVFGVDRLLIGLEGHGRQELDGGVNITRTVGWFTTIYPVWLHRGNDALTTLVQVKEQLRGVPQKGIGYGMLRYLGTPGLLEEMGRPDITFNYLGDFGSGVGSGKEGGGSALFGYSSEYRGREIGGDHPEESLLTVSGLLVGGDLQINIHYSKEQYQEEKIAGLSASYGRQLEELISTLSLITEDRLTPSDLSYKGLRVEELEVLKGLEPGKLEDVYELSPLQEGIYFHWLADPSTTAYVEQVSYRLRGTLDRSVLERSYRTLIARHAVLRTAFHHQYGSGCLQVVRSTVPDSFIWERIDPQEEMIARARKEERQRGFNLNHGGQMRLRVLDLGTGEYAFIWSHHHILMDGWCVSVLIREFYNIYRELLDGREPRLSQPSAYAGYISWLSSRNSEESRLYWERYLSGYERRSGIPFSRNQGEGGYVRKEISVLVDGELLKGLRRLSRSLEVTENTFIQGSWGYLLSRYNDMQDVVYGVVVSGRPGTLEGVEEMIGLFINTIAVRVRYDEDTTVEGLLSNLQRASIAGMDHHYLRLSELQGASELGNGLFDHLLVYENYPVQPMGREVKETVTEGLEEMTVLSAKVEEETNYDFSILVAPGEEQLRIIFRYNENRYRKEDMRRMGDQLLQVIHGFTKGEDQLVNTISYLSAAEEKQLLESFNITSIDYIRDRTIIDAFSEQVLLQPDQEAVADPDTSLTYWELEAQSNRLAHYLREQGVRRESRVALCLDRNLEMIIGIMGILKAGAAYVPLDPAYPKDRLAYMLSDSGAQWVISHSHYRELLETATPAPEIQKLYLDQLATTLDQQPAVNPGIDLSPNDLAYVIYTSGSTGQPKGVMIEHASVLNLINGLAEQIYNRYAGNLHVAVLAPFVFDGSVKQIFGALLQGHTLYIVPDDVKTSGALLWDFYSRNNIDISDGTPAHLLLLSAEEAPADIAIRHFLIGGEALPATWIDQVYRSFKEPSTLPAISNVYGPTEACVDSSIYTIDPARPGQHEGVIPIGRPITNVQLYILDSTRALLPVGIQGELYIGGAGLARGYWDRETLTNERFIRHRFGSGPEQRLYRTGDLCQWLEDGNIAYFGRIDDQVKIRGYRIELGEVEHALQQLEGIDSAVVRVYEGAAGDRSLIAYVVSRQEQPGAYLRQQLEQLLPAYMLPTYYVQLDRLPLTANGKIDRKALPGPDASAQSGLLYIAPQGDRQLALASGYEDVLHRTQVGARDHFFELGGDSIKAILLINRLKQKGYQIRVTDILKYPVLEELAEKLKRAETSSNQGPVEGPVLLTPIQRQFFLSSLPDAPKPVQAYHHYNQSVLLYSTEPIMREGLMKSLVALIHHHDALRMRYRNGKDGYEQFNRGLEEGLLFHLEEHDLRPAPTVEPTASTLQNAQRQLGRLCEQLQAGIDLEQGPLLRVGLFRLEDGDRLLLIIHHLVVDGVSWRILLEDLSTAYAQTQRGEEIRLPAKSDSFQQWANNLQTYAGLPTLHAELPYWEKIMHSTEETLKAELPESAAEPKDSKVLQFTLPADITASLVNRTYRSHHTEINDLLLTALSLSIQRTFALTSVLIELEGHGREQIMEGIDVSRTVGWFTSKYPVLLHMPVSNNPIAQLLQVRDTLREIPGKGIGYGILRYLYATEKDQRSTRPPITFNFLGDFDASGGSDAGDKPLFRMSGEFKGREAGNAFHRSSLLDFTGMIIGKQLSMTVQYSDAQYKAGTIQRLIDEYERSLKALITQLADGHSETAKAPLSYNQLTYFREDRIAHAYGQFHLKIAQFDKEQFLHAYTDLLSDFDQLRLRFSRNNNTWLQEVMPVSGIKPPLCIEQESLDLDSPAIKDIFSDLTGKRFDLQNGDTIRCAVAHDQREAFVYVVIHHSVTDESSNTLLRNAFIECYNGNRSSVRTGAPYSQYVEAQKEFLSSARGRQESQYWSGHLYPFTATADSSTVLLRHHQTIADQRYQLIMDYCRTNNIMPGSFILTLFCVFLRDIYPHKERYLVEMVVDGRDMDLPGFDMTDAIGQFVNHLPLAIPGDKTMDLERSAPIIQQLYWEGRLNQQIPYQLISENFRERHDLDLADLTDAVVNYIDHKDRDLHEKGQDYTEVLAAPDDPGNKGSLYIRCQAYGNCFTLQWDMACEKSQAERHAAAQTYLHTLNDLFVKNGF